MAETFNTRLYGNAIREAIPDIPPQDFKWLANKSAAMYRQIDDPCIDNYRVAKVGDAESEAKYQEAYESGCCGSWDETYTNAVTGNSYKIGFNYGH